jgi:hypothetical protein
MKIFFDMDGTIANLYGVENWLPMLIAENTKPYEIAKPLVNLSRLARRLNSLQRKGIEIGIISWGSKVASAEYDEAVEKAKIDWLAKHLASVTFDEIHVVKYGTPKATFATSANDILFDDEEPNRTAWSGKAYAESEIFEILASL